MIHDHILVTFDSLIDFLGQTWVLSKKTVNIITNSDPYETILEVNQKNDQLKESIL